MTYNKIKNILSISFLLSTSLLLFSCSSGRLSSEYRPFLSRDVAPSHSTELKVKIPNGWFTALDNENNLIDLWLIKDDYSAMLNFALINLDDAAVKEAGDNLLAAALKFSKKFRQTALKKELELQGEDEFIEIGANKFGIYKYKNGNGAIARVAVFRYKERIFEVTASPTPKADLKSFSSEELFLIQDAVLSSIE
jgi:hypothetical protein